MRNSKQDNGRNKKTPRTNKTEGSYKQKRTSETGKKYSSDDKPGNFSRKGKPGGNRSGGAGKKYQDTEKTGAGDFKSKRNTRPKSGPSKGGKSVNASGRFGKTDGGSKGTRGTSRYGSDENKSRGGFGKNSADRERSYDRKNKSERGDRETEKKYPEDKRQKRTFGKDTKSEGKNFGKNKNAEGSDKRSSSTSDRFLKNSKGKKEEKKPFRTIEPKGKKFGSNDRFKPKKENPQYKLKSTPDDESGLVRLNRYIANSGICSRREADERILEGLVEVNGKVVMEMGYKVKPGDTVRYDGSLISREKPVYLLLNKPKDFITTMDDPQERKTVMQLVAGACSERIYPVGRLDRNTTGLLLFTNDGAVAEKLTHPSNRIGKVYQVELDKPLVKSDLETIVEGKVRLEDGLVHVDEIAYVDNSKKVLGLGIHEGRNRIVRRLFESLGYEVVKLDRTMYAGLTKKDLPRGSWRFLTEKEVIKLKYSK